MKRSVILIGLSAAALVALHSTLWPQGTPAKAQGKQGEIEGVWTQAFDENEGKLRCFLPGAVKPDPLASPDALLWKISKDKMEIGPDNKSFPQHRWSYKLNPGDKAGAMDVAILTEGGKKPLIVPWEAIYQVKGDYLMICLNANVGGPRPEKFTTTGKPNTTWLYILRRGKLK